MSDPKEFPLWRSMLFLPAHVEKYIAKAHTRGADACILDLEDSVPLAEKANARQAIAEAAAQIARHDLGVLVRVNHDAQYLRDDLAASVHEAVRVIVVPKVNDADSLLAIDQQLAVLEGERGLAIGHTLLIAQIEDVRALPNLDAIAVASTRLMGMSLGSEDFSVSAGTAPVPQALLAPNQMVAFACRRAGIQPLGFPASIADFSDLDVFAQTVDLASQLGFVGAFCIHPSQAALLNMGFSPSAAAVAEARALLAEAAVVDTGRGAFAFHGKMVDPPVIARAEEILRRHQAFSNRSPRAVD